jgi:hypothetical protein
MDQRSFEDSCAEVRKPLQPEGPAFVCGAFSFKALVQGF